MRNIDYIRSLGVKQLAEFLVQCESEPDYDYDWDEELQYEGQVDVYVTSDGKRFDQYSKDDAIQHECWWLNQEIARGETNEQGTEA